MKCQSYCQSNVQFFFSWGIYKQKKLKKKKEIDSISVIKFKPIINFIISSLESGGLTIAISKYAGYEISVQCSRF